jgi:uncharacterized protein (TIGR03032 family)
MSEPVQIHCQISSAFEDWLAQSGGSLAVSTYQAGKVAMIGHDGRQVTLLMRDFDKPLGLVATGNRLVLSTRNDLWIFTNSPVLAHEYQDGAPGRYDSLYLPRATYHTNDLHTHDVAVTAEGIVLVATRFCCLAKPSLDFSFIPFWKPKFITDLVPEDRCHLNGVAVRDGEARYVTALGTSDTAGGWRERKADGGVLMDVRTSEIMLGGLSMPHSPRWYDNRLWVLNSGAGELLVVDPQTGRSEVACRLPGYLRGLTFVGPYALVGLCKIREKHIFGGLPVQKDQANLPCGIALVDLRSGTQAGFFEFTEGCEELFEIQFLPHTRRPMILNLDKPQVHQAMNNPSSAFWLRPSSEIHDAPPLPRPVEPLGCNPGEVGMQTADS